MEQRATCPSISHSAENALTTRASVGNSTVNPSHATPNRTSIENANDIDLMRTILGEQVPKSVILTCLHTCAYIVSDALNYYFMEIAPLETHNPLNSLHNPLQRISSSVFLDTNPNHSTCIHSGLAFNLHARYLPGIIGKSESYHATLRHGTDAAIQVLKPNNEKNVSIFLRRRKWKRQEVHVKHSEVTVQSADIHFPYFMNGDVVTLECNGLWLRSVGPLYSNRRTIQWKQPSDDDRAKFVIRGLPLGRYLRPGDYFFLTSYKWKEKELVLREERPNTLTSFHTNANRYFLSVERIKVPAQRLFLYAKLTDSALESLPQQQDPIDASKLVIMTAATARRSTMASHRGSSKVLSEIDAKITQMANIVGNTISRDSLAEYLDGAGGNVQVAMEHFFMAQSLKTDRASRLSATESSKSSLQTPSNAPSETAAEAQALAVTQAKAKAMAVRSYHDTMQHRPVSELLIPIPSITDTFSCSDKHSAFTTSPSAPLSSKSKAHTFNAFSNQEIRENEPEIIQICDDSEEEKRDNDTLFLQTSADRLSSPQNHHANSNIVESTTVLETDPFQEIEALTIHDFEMLSVLGKGSFAAVMLVRFKKDNRIFALKILKKNNMDGADRVNAMEERQILQRIHHPYICGLLFAFQTNERLYLGMKYYAAGDLFYHLNLRGSLNVADARLYAAELVLAVSYLHKLNILYRDLKPSNIMIDDQGHIAVVDFGLSKQHIYKCHSGVRTLSGTAEYVAPEALAQAMDGTREYGKAYDWWSLGIVLYEMLVGESPFYHENEHTMLRRIAFEDVVFPPNFPSDAVDLVSGLLCKDPSKRLGCTEALDVETIKSNVFFRGIDWEKLERREVKAFWRPKLSSETDTRYVDPEFIDDGPPSAAYDPSAGQKRISSRRFSQFSFNYLF